MVIYVVNETIVITMKTAAVSPTKRSQISPSEDDELENLFISELLFAFNAFIVSLVNCPANS